MPATTARRRGSTRAVGDGARAERREAILAAAKTVFAAKGFHATKIADVAGEAGTAYGSIYWYFDSKDALFLALMDQQEAALRAHIERSLAVGRRAGGEAMFRGAVQATFEFFEADRDITKLLFRDALVLGDRFDRHLASIYEGFIADIEATIADAQASGQVIEAPPRIIAFSVAALISQLALRRIDTDDGLGAADLADIVVTMLVEGLRPRSSTTRSRSRQGGRA